MEIIVPIPDKVVDNLALVAGSIAFIWTWIQHRLHKKQIVILCQLADKSGGSELKKEICQTHKIHEKGRFSMRNLILKN